MTNAEWMKANLSFRERILIFCLCQMFGKDMNKFIEWLDEDHAVSIEKDEIWKSLS